jgi:hypothetical protein
VGRKTKKNPVGRPPKEERDRKRNILSMRVRDELRTMLAAQAEANQRSLSEEAEIRLEQSFSDRRVAESVLSLASLDQHTLALVTILTRAVRDAGFFAAIASTEGGVRSVDWTTNPYASLDWMSNPYAFQQVEEAIGTILAGLKPDGDVAPKDDPEILVGLGKRFAAGILEAIRNPNRFGDIGRWAKPIAASLGEKIVARIQSTEPRINIGMRKPSRNFLFAEIDAKGRKDAG